MAKGNRKRKNRRKRNRQIVELTPAEKFTQLQTLKRATRCLLVDEDVYKIYVRLTREFDELGRIGEETPFEGCEECAALSEECKALAEEWKKKLPAERKVESRTVITTVREREKRGDQKKGKGKWVFLGIVALIALFIICYRVPATRYMIAGLENAIGFDGVARDSYAKLGDYKDSRERIVKLEQKSMSEVKTGSVITFGHDDWMVLERKDGKALLAKYMADNKHPFHDKKEDITWEKCTLRQYLNGEFLTTYFSEEERAIIEDSIVTSSDNAEFGTDGGRDTVDKVFLMDESQYETYKKKLKDKSKTMRLRTPGKDATSTTYVSALGDVVTYGFPVEQNGACIRPVMWVRYQ